MIMLKVLIQYAEVTSDQRVIPFMTKYFRYQAAHLKERPLTGWSQARGGENMLCVLWLYNRTGEAFLLDLLDLLHVQSFDWSDIFTHFPFWRPQTAPYDLRAHVVNIAMALKEPALYWLYSGHTLHHEAALRGIQNLTTYHGQVNGMFSGDEMLAGTHPSQGTELCAVVEYMFTLENLVRILGDGLYADLLEKVTFNALPATISQDWRSHQYDQQVNQVLCTLAKRNWTANGDESNLFGLEPNYGCCTSNMHQGWPKFAAHLWMATPDGGLAAISYAPCRVSALVAHGTPVELQVTTKYPFDEHIDITLRMARPAHFPIKLRIPAWCTDARLAINERLLDRECACGEYVTLNDTWQHGDRLRLTLPMPVAIERRGQGALSIQRGPLVYALAVEERWQKLRGSDPYADWEIYPASPWNYGLAVDKARPQRSLRIETRPLARQPFTAKEAPLRLLGKGRRIPDWTLALNSADTPPLSPVTSNEPLEEITLVPYGSARLRIAEFPVLSDTPQPED